jgi:hypothetical protein
MYNYINQNIYESLPHTEVLIMHTYMFTTKI